MSVNFIYSGGDLVMMLCGNSVTITEDDDRFMDVVGYLRDGLGEADIYNALYEETEEVEGVEDVVEEKGDMYMNGDKVHKTIAARITAQLALGLPTVNLENFLHNIKQNPSFTSREEAYDFLDNKGLPITEDGYVLAYKAVNEDFTGK